MDFKAVDERVPTWVCVLERERKKERKKEIKKERKKERKRERGNVHVFGWIR